MAEEEDDGGNDDGKIGDVVAVETITHTAEKYHFTTSIVRAEEYGYSDILVLKQLQENVLKASFQAKTI